MRKGIQKIFSEIAETYELVNHVLTLGLDIVWRKKAARQASRVKGFLWLDVCSGTGEMAFNLSRQADEKIKIVSVDFCYPMIAKAQQKRKTPNLSFALAESGLLPFADATFDLVVISFATRNIYSSKSALIAHLKEFYRVLKPGGYFINLETSQPPLRIVQKLFHLYVKLVVQPLGFFLSGSKPAYEYLAYTISRFFSPEKFSSILQEAGFARVSHRSLFLGVSAIHTAVK
jgi:demethylmenaquinone methyltransferase/2-methoxy-6-polyprenyl-1,4-benzoquinol methylase